MEKRTTTFRRQAHAERVARLRPATGNVAATRHAPVCHVCSPLNRWFKRRARTSDQDACPSPTIPLPTTEEEQQYRHRHTACGHHARQSAGRGKEAGGMNETGRRCASALRPPSPRPPPPPAKMAGEKTRQKIPSPPRHRRDNPRTAVKRRSRPKSAGPACRTIFTPFSPPHAPPARSAASAARASRSPPARVKREDHATPAPRPRRRRNAVGATCRRPYVGYKRCGSAGRQAASK